MHRHDWRITVLSNKAWVYCHACAKKYPFPTEGNGSKYAGPVPAKWVENDRV